LYFFKENDRVILIAAKEQQLKYSLEIGKVIKEVI